MIGGTVGYNYQSGPLVVGVEADLDWADINGSAAPFPGISANATINELNSIRARLGYSFDRAMVYVTGGWAGAIVSGDVNNFVSRPNLIINESHYMNGYHWRGRRIFDHPAGLGQSRISLQFAWLEYVFQRHGECHQPRREFLDRTGRRQLSFLIRREPDGGGGRCQVCTKRVASKDGTSAAKASSQATRFG